MNVGKIICTIIILILISIIIFGIIWGCQSNRDRESAIEKSREIEKRSTELALRLNNATAGLEKSEAYGRAIQTEVDRIRTDYDRSEAARRIIANKYNQLKQLIDTVESGFEESLRRIDIIETGLGSIESDIRKLQH
jgi:chromosome segregation ATPase